MNVTLPLHRHALRQPSKPAIIGERRMLTYRQLDRLVWQGAAFFRAGGLGAGDRVALVVENPLVHLVISLALARFGVAFVPLAPGESSLMIESFVERTGARAVVAEARIPGVERCAQIVVDAAAFSGGGTKSSDLMSENSDLIWTFVTSSGTTGKAKLFAASHAGWWKFLPPLQLAIPTAAADVFLSLPRPYFFGAVVHNLEVLTSGGTVVLPSSMTPDSLFALMARSGVNRVNTSTGALKSLLDAPGSAAAMAQLSVVAVGGSVVSRPLRAATLKLTPGLLVSYGCTEIGYFCSTRHLEGAAIAGSDSVGHPVAYGELEIVDSAGRSRPPGEVGEVRARRDAMISAYFDDRRADERQFRNGWFYPGDLACWSDDGQVIFKGRADDMMIFDGINIYPTEIETSLHEHPRVAEVISFPMPSRRHGQVPVAAVRISGGEVSEAELIGFCRERLGMRYPRRIMIVEDFARNEMGKPLKREMAKVMMQSAETQSI